jgi:hypothetical protein
MGGWWLKLADQPIRAVQLLAGDPVQVAAWLSSERVHFYAAHTGAFYESRRVTVPVPVDVREGRWQRFVDFMRAPNGARLPVYDVDHTQIHTSYDGRLRLYALQDAGLMLDVDRRLIALALAGEANVISLGLDREFGSIAALTDDGRLHIYQQQVYVGAFGIENEWADELPFGVFLPDSAGVVVLVGETQIQIWDMAGRALHRLAAPAPIGAAACSPDGERIVTGDRDQAVIRVYNGQLVPLRQGSAPDVLDRAVPVQLLAALPPNSARLDALAVMDDDLLVFALDGTLCQTSLREFDRLPQPRTLL